MFIKSQCFCRYGFPSAPLLGASSESRLATAPAGNRESVYDGFGDAGGDSGGGGGSRLAAGKRTFGDYEGDYVFSENAPYTDI
jgi:hypothetical protein